MPRVGASPGGAPSSLCRVSRWFFDTPDNLSSSLTFSVSIRLTPFLRIDSLRTLLVTASQPDRERIRHQQHRHGHDDARGGGALEDLLRAADPVVYLGGQRHVAIERPRGDVGLVERDPDDQDGRGLAHGPRERQDDARKRTGQRPRQQMTPDHLPLRGPQSVAALPDGVGYGPEGLPGRDDDDGQDEQAQRQRAGEHAPAARYGRQELHEDAQAEKAVDHRGHPGEVGY